MGDEQRHRVGVLDRSGEAAFHRAAVEIEAHHPVHPAGGDQLRHHARAQRLAARHPAIVPRIAEVGDDRGHRARAQPLARVGDQRELEQVLAHRRVQPLHHEDLGAPHLLQQLDVELAVGEALDVAAPERNLQLGGDLPGEGGVRRTSQQDGAHADFLPQARVEEITDSPRGEPGTSLPLLKVIRGR